ncbi:transporter substrate-binding domain-containing protein [Microbulbifer sp.]|uniref:transporter substrate-binding domain-containing protein n=1 Tax=Microbulbifer sp. TaxID=1908541 RepID=UPI002588E982|nr:transporter substrate-binding domain-containing protein [Microbulbifer sp.]
MGTPPLSGTDCGHTRSHRLSCPRILIPLTICLMLMLCGCDRSDNEYAPSGEQIQGANTSPTENTKKTPRRTKTRDYDFENYVETGDLKALKKRGVIRFVGLSADDDDMLPRSAVVTMKHFHLATELAERLGLEPRWVQASSPEHALQLLNEGKADIVAANLTRTKEREKNFALSQAIDDTKQVLVTSRENAPIDEISDLEGRTLSVLEGSTYADTARKLKKKIPSLKLDFWEVRKSGNLDRLLDRINQEKDFVTILDSNMVDSVADYRQDFQRGAILSDTEEIVWATRKKNPNLKHKLNTFLTRKLVSAPERTASDWKSIRKSRVLRLLTYNGPTSYFMWQGALMGFDYDLALKFAKKHDLELQVIVVPYDESLIDWLKAGKGDIAGASTTVTEERNKQGIQFTTPYLEMREQVISNTKKPKIETLQDLNGRTLTLRAYSSFIETARALQKSGIDLKIETADPDVSYAQLLNMVADGEIDATIADASAVKIAANLRDTATGGVMLSDPRAQAWMVLPENRRLLAHLNNFIGKYRKTGDYAVKVRTYFEPDERFAKKIAARVQPGEDISPYDNLVKNAAKKHDIDWLLVTAQMWQESSFNPKAESPVGAQGLLQVMPRTAEEMGYPPPLFDPERGLQAGVKYLDWLRDRFDPEVDLQNRLWLSLAAYNAGIGHVYDAQRLAETLGLDRNVWFDNVEVAMLKLSEPRYFNKARYGYARGAEPVEYVRKISRLYRAYSDVKSEGVASLFPREALLLGSGFTRSKQSCRYAHWTPSDGAPRPLPPAEKWRRSEGPLCQ